MFQSRRIYVLVFGVMALFSLSAIVLNERSAIEPQKPSRLMDAVPGDERKRLPHELYGQIRAADTSTLQQNGEDQPDDAEFQSLFSELRSSADPKRKRDIRIQLAAMQPSSWVLRRMLSEYYAAESEGEIRLHVLSVISQMKPDPAILAEIGRLAKETGDEELFVNLVYALANSRSRDAKQIMFELLRTNQLPRESTDSPLYSQGLGALHRNLIETLDIADVVWLTDIANSDRASPAQLLTARQFLKELQHQHKESQVQIVAPEIAR
jgi:hypothetical protein